MAEPCYDAATYKSVGIHTPTLYLDVASSIYEPATQRGEDDVVAGLPGRFRRNRIPDVRTIELVGYTRGIGATIADRQESWHDAEEDLGGLLDPNTGGTLLLIAGYLGLPGNASVTAYPLNWIAGVPQGTMTYRRWTIELEAVGNPPDWSVA